MRRLLVLIGLAGILGAQAPLRIVAVDRKGLPPYETQDRVYRLDGGSDRGLHVGQRLAVRRSGEPRALGHLQITGVRGHEAEGTFSPAGEAFPLKGDLVWRDELAALPAILWQEDPLPRPATPAAMPAAPPQEGLIFFLPQRADLSPAGLAKVDGWVKAWGTEGRWVVQVPASPALRPALQTQRAEVLQSALRTLGVAQAEVEKVTRTAEGKFDPMWLKHWD